MGETPDENKNTSCDIDFSGRRVISLNQRFIISENELPQVILDALKGDTNAAFKVMLHFNAGMSDSINGFKWRIIGAENGHHETQNSLVNVLLNFSDDDDSETRGIFWLYELAKIGYEGIEDDLQDYNYTPETVQPPDDSLFPDNYVLLSETELAECKTGALRGNRKAAQLLGKYYSEIKVDDELSEYWYRIGAQNGSPECQYILGQIMIAREDEFDQIRGRFWLDRAIKNGNMIQN